LLRPIPMALGFDRAMFRRTLGFGSNFIVFSISSLLFSQLDRTLIGLKLGVDDVTYYVVPITVAMAVHQITAKMMQIVFPLTTEMSVFGERAAIRHLFFRVLNGSLLAGLTVAIPIVSLANPLLHFWLSPEFAVRSTHVLQLLALAYLLMGMTSAPASVLPGI